MAYFRQLAQPGEQLDIHTDAESKIEKYQRLLMFLWILMLPLMISLINLRSRPYDWLSFIYGFIAVIFVLYVYAIIKLWLRINQLKRL